jgi:S-adenosylmethionine-diacylgycerolhomoserine-N-methlytransferase
MSDAMQRERMDAIYRTQRHFYDVTRRYYLLGRDRLIEGLAPPGGGTVLEVGCGTGRNMIVAARRWPDARFHGFDISPAMLETARTNIARAGLAERIGLSEGDATGFDPQTLFGVEAFDRVFLSYTLSMIPNWQAAIGAAAKAVKPGGEVHIVDFGQQERLPAAFRAALFAWLARFDVTPRDELERALAAATRDVRGSYRFVSMFRGYAWSGVVRRG